MTPTERDGDAAEATFVSVDQRLADQLRAIQRALDERRDAEGNWGVDDAGWLREAGFRSPR
ncbi:MAG TPA: hypothetical protein VMD91_00500 [Candidatus Sulfotelmatobacter sp.]|nr:hypothetical protein [Candidatus Sulfotelmatobacter sp.]